MRTLSAALQSAHSGPVQRPAWLVEINFASVSRLSSYGTVSFGGYSWIGYDIDVSRIRVDAMSVQGDIVIGNADDAFGATVLSEGVSDRRIRIYGYDAGATASGDFELLADCVGGAATIDETHVRITVRDPGAYVSSPRTFVNAAAGFTNLLPEGARISINGQTWTLGRN